MSGGRFKDFTQDSQPISFMVGEETFHAYEDIPLKHLSDLFNYSAAADDPDQTGTSVTRMVELFEKFLTPESYERFRECCLGDNPPVVIGFNRLKNIIPWLMEQYGLRPTEASSGSSTTSDDDGAISTDGAQLTDAIPKT